MQHPIFTPARRYFLLLLIVLAAGVLLLSLSRTPAKVAAGAAAGNTATTQRQPVLVELFTSEGCSSCPPADALLARLDATQFVTGAQAIVLSEHVTYWNHLGWRDPFSFEAMSQRQQDYATRFGLDGVYTPQAVVDGSVEMVGSDSGALSHAIASAAAKPKAEITIEGAAWKDNAVHFAVRTKPDVRGTLMAALANDETVSVVGHGENAGQTLHHVAVVRVLTDMGRESPNGKPLVLEAAKESGQAAQQASSRLVVFLTDQQTGRVLAVAEKPITQ